MEQAPRSVATGTLRTEQVVAAVRTLFRRYGYRRTSVDDIAREAGISKATLYLHFKSKEEMFRAMSNQFRALVIARCRDAEMLEAPLCDRLVALLYARYGTALEWFGDAAHIHELTDFIRDELAAAIDQDIAAFQARVEALLGLATSAGEIGPAPAPVITQAALTMIYAAHGAKYAQRNGVEGFREVLVPMVKLVIGGLIA